MKHEVKIGQTDYSVLILIRDDAGAPKTGLAYTDIDLAYSRVETDNDVTTTDVAPADLATPALTDPHLDWGFLEVSATDHPGVYRLDIADAVFATAAWSAVVTATGTGLDPTSIEFVMVPLSPYSGVELGDGGLTAAKIGADAITASKIADEAIDAATFAADTDVYMATINVAVDGAGTPDDEWACTWYKNGVPVTSGITSPEITVKAVANPATTKIVDAQTMTADASYAGTLFYNASGGELMAGGKAYICVCVATIDGASRTAIYQHVRDTSA